MGKQAGMKRNHHKTEGRESHKPNEEAFSESSLPMDMDVMVNLDLPEQ